MKLVKTSLAVIVFLSFLAASCTHRTCPTYSKLYEKAPEKASLSAYMATEQAR